MGETYEMKERESSAGGASVTRVRTCEELPRGGNDVLVVKNNMGLKA